MQPNCPVFRSTQLAALKVEEFVRRNLLWQRIVAVLLQHGREDDAVEYDVVLSDEVYDFCILAFPVLLPIVRQKFLSGTDVSDRCVKPDVHDLALGTLNRYRDSPIQIAGHCARLQSIAGIQPAHALANDVGFPIFAALQERTQIIAEFVERQEPICRIAQLRFSAA